MEKIISIRKISEQGVSRPYLCTDEGNRVRWCKGNHTGLRSIISEWVCARLARRIGLPIPNFAIMKLDLSLFREWRTYQNVPVPEIVTETNPFVFASLNVENCKDVLDPETDLKHIDRTLLAKIYFFDKWIHNTDRTDGNSNLLVNGNVYIIDHNNAFDPCFSESSFAADHILRDFGNAIPAWEKDTFMRFCTELARGPFLEEIWSELPEEWTDVGNDLLPLPFIRAILLEGGYA